MGKNESTLQDSGVGDDQKNTALTAADFVHLHNHTQYSLLDGLTKINKLVDFVKECGMKSVAITDHGTLSGWIEFYKTCKASDIKPLLGIETYVASRGLQDKDPGKDRARFHLILIAINAEGVRNIMQLSTTANLEGFYYYPRIDRELLEKYSAGIVVLSGCMGSELGQALKDGRDKDARIVAEWYSRVFGDRYYLEIQDHGHPDNPLHSSEQYGINKKIMALGKELGIKCVVTSDAHYLKHEDQDAHEVLLCVGTGSYLSDTKRMSLKNYPLHVATPEEIIGRWGAEYPEYIRSTAEIASRVDFDFELGKILIPKFEVPEGETEKSYLDILTWRGLAWRYGGQDRQNMLSIKECRSVVSSEIVERADYELSVIESMGFNGYFLIIWDFIKWGKDAGIVFGPGRGSAAGSIIAYSLRITELNPLAYGLLFERFLNPDRISMPDIDIDIADDRRDEVIEYCRAKYGASRVANIVTFGKMAARNAIRDTARVLQIPYADADRLSKMVPPPVQGRHTPLAKSLVDVPDLKAEYESNPISRQIFDMAVQLEGTIRSHGVHAAGVVIAPDDIVKFAPLEMAQKGVVTTQFSMNPIEDLGLLKMDFLGLSNLTTIKNALRIIKKVYGNDLDIGTIPLDDDKTFELLQRGDTTGVFQFESSGMKRYLKELKPTLFDDVIAMGALYRPGPLSAGLTDSFIKRKNGLEEVSVPHPLMENALGTTFGVLVYQEQVMQVSRDACGFTGGEADTLRKAIGKKKLDVMEKMKVQFIDGAITKGVPKLVIEKFWQDLLGFADYCFNKSHSACYGLISYQTAYLKAHYPSAFMAAVMTSDWDNIDRLAIEIAECKHMGITVLPPSVNYSYHEFSVANDSKNTTGDIRFGLDAIKNVGKGAVEEILRAREDGPFANINDFIFRVSSRIVNRKTWESLIKTGAMDEFGDRGSLLNSLDVIVALASKVSKERSSAQIDIFGGESSGYALPSLQLVAPSEPLQNHTMLVWERELLGLYLSHHPLEEYEHYLSEQTIPTSEVCPENDGKIATIGGTISEIRQITTKNGQNMAFIKLEDQFGEVELIIFPNLYKDSVAVWQLDNVITAEGKITARDKNGGLTTEAKFMPDSAKIIDAEIAKNYMKTGIKKLISTKTKKSSKYAESKQSVPRPTGPKKLYLRVADDGNPQVLEDIKSALDNSKGACEVVLVLGPPAKKQALKLPFTVEVNEELTRKLAEVIGATNVVVQ